MNKLQLLKGDLNNNGSIDNTKEARANIEFNAKDIAKLQTEIKKLKREMTIDTVSKSNEFASSAKLAEELTDGKQRVFFNNIGKSVVFKNGNKPITSCVQICSNDNSIKNVSHIHFDNSTFKGLINDYTTEITQENASQCAPSMNYLLNYVDPSLEVIGGNLIEINTKIQDITYNATNSKTTIANNLEVEGNIISNWLNTEFAKYALLNHNHEFADIYKNVTKTIVNENTNEEEEVTETKTLQEILDEYEQSMNATITSGLATKANTSHTHEFADIYKTVTKTIVNENTNEEEEVTETKSLQEILTEYETNLTSTINTGLATKANSSHTHEISNIYKTIVSNDNGTTTTTNKPLETLLNEKEAALQALINGKANSSHTHNATEITYKENVNVKKAIDDINSQLDIKDSNGNKIDILGAIFGTTTGIGAVIDGGLIAAVTTLQNEVGILQGEIATLATEGLTSDVLDAVDSAGDIIQGGTGIWNGLKGIANAFKQIKNAAKGYVSLANEAAIPLNDIPLM